MLEQTETIHLSLVGFRVRDSTQVMIGTWRSFGAIGSNWEQLGAIGGNQEQFQMKIDETVRSITTVEIPVTNLRPR